jgi:hypothetical protein
MFLMIAVGSTLQLLAMHFNQDEKNVFAKNLINPSVIPKFTNSAKNQMHQFHLKSSKILQQGVRQLIINFANNTKVRVNKII